MSDSHSVFAEADRVVPAAWGPFGEDGPVAATPFAYPIADFYRTDPISRASATMAECSALIGAACRSSERTGSHG